MIVTLQEPDSLQDFLTHLPFAWDAWGSLWSWRSVFGIPPGFNPLPNPKSPPSNRSVPSLCRCSVRDMLSIHAIYNRQRNQHQQVPWNCCSIPVLLLVGKHSASPFIVPQNNRLLSFIKHDHKVFCHWPKMVRFINVKIVGLFLTEFFGAIIEDQLGERSRLHNQHVESVNSE